MYPVRAMLQTGGGAFHGDLRRRTAQEETAARDRTGPVAAFGRELRERIGQLETEIERLKADIDAKGATKVAAEALFRR
jgi:uncharacterized small protein (DUF1192 family)